LDRESREETREQVNDIEVTKRIEATDPGAKIVIVTDYDDSELRRAAMDVGACNYALKDNLPDLVHLLEAIESNRSTRDSK
jgi:DNA-binding NarL/FixJ family response regulator